jgi:hypothetical protein
MGLTSRVKSGLSAARAGAGNRATTHGSRRDLTLALVGVGVVGGRALFRIANGGPIARKKGQ